ncbi:TolC family outer membrane protein [soil metagenome]
MVRMTMLKRHFLMAGAALASIAVPASAETLREALAKAYQTNPTLSGARADLRATDENVPIARAAGLPGASLTGSYNRDVLNAAPSPVPNQQALGSANISLPIFSGGAVRNSVAAAKTRVEAGRAGLRGTEANMFTNVVAAYMDVIRDEAIVQLNKQNVKVLGVNVDASNDRFQVGDLTRTDVAQSQARAALALGQLQTAQARLISSRENYIALVGSAPVNLEVPPPLPNLPASPDAAVEIALQNNPNLLAAQKARDATRYDIGVARAATLPKLSVGVGGNYYNYLNSAGPAYSANSGTSGSAGVSLSLPLFQGGRPAAQVRQAQARRSQAIEAVTETERGVISQTRSAYAIWMSSQQVIASSETAVNANKLSLEGVRAENGVGNRTILDILNAEQELLNAQVTLVTARRDAYVAGFALMAAMGQAEARDLGLDGGPLYDPVANYNRVHHKISDFGSDPEPVGISTSTAQTKAQNADVGDNLDPALDTPVDTDRTNPSGGAAPVR